jgi:succinate dehydrogenase/fumarate reductase flavoprotein subunit
MAGMVAARRMQQLDLKPLVIEKGGTPGGLGNAAISGGLIHMAWEPPDAPVERKRHRLDEETDGEIDPGVAEALAVASSDLIPWLLDEGVEMRQKTEAAYTRWTLHPFRYGTGRRLDWELGPGRALARLYANLDRDGGEVLGSSAATSLDRDGSLWRVGYRSATRAGEVMARTVVVADGGFQANAEMLARYVGPNAGLCLLRGATTGTGDGLRLVLALGAAATGLGRVYGHMVSRAALGSDELWPFPHLDDLCLQGALVDRHGDLWPGPDGSVVALVTRLARTDDPRGFTAVFDRELWQTAGRHNPFHMATANPDLPERGGPLLEAGTVEELADRMGVPRARLSHAVHEHGARPGARPLEDGPFYAAPALPGITFTMGGAAIDAGAAVRHRDGGRLPGLFAAGSTVGGVHGGPNGGYVGGLAVAATLGCIAAGSAAELLRRGG